LISRAEKDNLGNVVENKRILGYKTLVAGPPVKVWQSFPFLNLVLEFQNNGSLPPFLPITLGETTAFTIDAESFKPGYEVGELYSGDAVLRVEKSFHYNSFHQLKRRKIFNSNGGFEREDYKYPWEYENPSTEILNLISKNIVDDPIEFIKYGENGAFKGEARKWKVKSGKILLDEVLNLETNSPIRNFSHSSNGVSFSESFVTKTKMGHDYNFNVNRIEENGQNVKSFLWGYNHKLLICEVINAEPNHISYTSFETDEKGGWSYAGNAVFSIDSKTGGKYYDLETGRITKSGLGANTENKFLLTFWVKAANGSGAWDFMGQSENLGKEWKFVQREISNSTVTIEGSGLHLDELRLHPIDAGLITYTYDPLVGVKTKTDSRNYTMYYDYDPMGRLKAIKDDNGQLKELYQYNFQTSGLIP
jgi:hypothetical protein